MINKITELIESGLTQEKISEILNISDRTLRRYIKKNNLTGRKPNPECNLQKTCLICSNILKNDTRCCSLKCNAKYQKSLLIDKWKCGELKINVRSTTIKNYLLEKSNNQCEICKLKDWNNKPIVLILDHKDGNSENWLEENLQVICPNCDSQLPTFKNRNKGNGRHYRMTRYNNEQSY